jgi:hypothetical protein
MTYRQYRAWYAWLNMEQNRPSRSDHYLMVLSQRLDNIEHMFDKSWKGKALENYKIPFGSEIGAVKAPEKKPGKVPCGDGEWWPHPLTKTEVESGRKAHMLARFGL